MLFLDNLIFLLQQSGKSSICLQIMNKNYMLPNSSISYVNSEAYKSPTNIYRMQCFQGFSKMGDKKLLIIYLEKEKSKNKNEICFKENVN